MKNCIIKRLVVLKGQQLGHWFTPDKVNFYLGYFHY